MIYQINNTLVETNFMIGKIIVENEKECINSKWSKRELKRRIDSSLFQRLLSNSKTNKKKVLELSKKGQTINNK